MKENKSVISYFPFAKDGDRFEGPADCVDGVCSVVVSGNSEEEIIENINTITKDFNNMCVWEDI